MKPLRAARPLAISTKSVVALVLSASPAVAVGAGCGVADSVPIPIAGAHDGTGDELTSTGAASIGAGPSGGSAGDPGAGSGAGREQAIGTVVSRHDVVRILAIGDTGEGNLAQNQVADRMSEKCIEVGGCHAVMMNGDNFYDHGVVDTIDTQWGPKFEQPYDRPGLNGLPFYAVLGNHDYGPSSSGVRQAQIDYSRLPVGDGSGMRLTDKWHMPASYYDVRVGDVHLFGIDTVDFTSDDQARYMSARVAASDATWKIAFGHHPRYTSGAHASDNPSLGMSGMFAMQQAIYCGTDMYMAGHDHNLEFIDKGRDEGCPNTYFAVSGAGSKIRPVSSSIPTEPGQLFFTDKTEGFAYLRFEGRNLLFEFIDKQGVVIFTKTMTK
ncbi:tartrate-resistant acid phosphatase type 5 family protein [Sorangium sp. So ce448]|uniref:purple acid phosphatase family protein n=1 Tax=Sorangium sp. So ce448 TaxID=3133314 RepID=UPI003F621071